jgi:heme-degrading monooxygenase HmoA
MHATMRYYHGNPGLADQLAARADEVRALLRAVSGFQSYYLVRLDEATVSITVCDDEAGTEESTSVAAEWIRDNMPDVAASPPMVSSGTVTLSA